jgi:hypothetical protein
MKKIWLAGLTAVLVCGLIVPAVAGNGLKILVNGKASAYEGVTINKMQYVPVSLLTKQLGIKASMVNGKLNISTSNGDSKSSIDFNKVKGMILPQKNAGETVEKGNIKYSVERIDPYAEQTKDYINLIFSEELSNPGMNFGKLPEFVVQTTSDKLFKLTDYSVISETNSQFENNNYVRTFIYKFPSSEEIKYIYYYPEGFEKSSAPIGKWKH